MFKVELPEDKPNWKHTMPFQDLPQGTTNYCLRCEMEGQMKKHPEHTCDIPVPSPSVEKHVCCDGECNHDDCCGKVSENCPFNLGTPEVPGYKTTNASTIGIHTPPQDWEIGLTQLISKTWKKGLWHSASNMMIDLKSFISSLLDKERERIVESIKQLPDTYEDDESRVFRTTIKEVLEKIDVE